MKKFEIKFRNAEEPSQNQISNCTQTDLHKYVGINMANAIIENTQFTTIQFSVTITTDLQQWEIIYTK